jgi:hypothetical protein
MKSYVESLARSLRQMSIALGLKRIDSAPRSMAKTVTWRTLKVKVLSCLSKDDTKDLATFRKTTDIAPWRGVSGRKNSVVLDTAIIDFGFQGGNRVIERHKLLFLGAQPTDCDRPVLDLTLADRELNRDLRDTVFANLV